MERMGIVLAAALIAGCASYGAGQDAASQRLKRSPFNLVGAWRDAYQASRQSNQPQPMIGPLTGKTYPTRSYLYVREVNLDAWIKANPGALDNETVAKLLDGKIWIGMSSDWAKFVLGNPKDINRTVYAHGVHEQWVYTCGAYDLPCRFYYFENGELASWQDQTQ